MQIVINMPDSTTKEMLENYESGSIFDEVLRGALKQAIILPKGHEVDVLDKLRAEIDNIEINGYVRDVECFNMGIRYALNIIDKYKGESEET